MKGREGEVLEDDSYLPVTGVEKLPFVASQEAMSRSRRCWDFSGVAVESPSS